MTNPQTSTAPVADSHVRALRHARRTFVPVFLGAYLLTDPSVHVQKNPPTLHLSADPPRRTVHSAEHVRFHFCAVS
jgi:hypothetical protein